MIMKDRKWREKQTKSRQDDDEDDDDEVMVE